MTARHRRANHLARARPLFPVSSRPARIPQSPRRATRAGASPIFASPTRGYTMLLRFLVLTFVAALMPAYVHAAGVNPILSTAKALAATATMQTQTPYLGAVRSLPGRVEAEHFDEGGQNVAYFESDGIANTYFRAGDVDLELQNGLD